MHFYTKESPFGDRVVDFYHGEVLKAFNFLYFAHSDHHETYKEILRDPKRRHAFFDLAAAYAAQLQYRDMLKYDTFAEYALRYFKLGLQARGYRLATKDELEEISRNFQRTVVLVTGCQTPEVRNARVEGAYAALFHLDVSDVKVVLSGTHPGLDQRSAIGSERYPIEPDEAGAMKVRFAELLESEAHPPNCKLQFHKEESSTRTAENVKEFFQQYAPTSATRNHLLVSSSAFHLPRICDELENYLKVSKLAIDRVTLVQPEHLSVDRLRDTLRHQIYVKQMTYELFRMMLSQVGDRLDDLFKRETSLRV